MNTFDFLRPCPLLSYRRYLSLSLVAVLSCVGGAASLRAAVVAPVVAPVVEGAPSTLLHLPHDLPGASVDGRIHVADDSGNDVTLTINPDLQERLTEFLRSKNDPIAAIVMVDVATGEILAMAQGRQPEQWGSSVHSALYAGFPAASLFKTVVTAAALEMSDMTEIDEDRPMPLDGDCSRVRPSSLWSHRRPSARGGMTMRRAFGKSCNGFFANIVINDIGIGPVNAMAERFGWGQGYGADFVAERSELASPPILGSSARTVGRYAAGFGRVTISAMHSAWMVLALANDGMAKPLRIRARANDMGLEDLAKTIAAERLVSAETARRIRGMMASTIRGGTASGSFRVGPYRRIRELVGGKTGTLTGQAPRGLTTLFAGIMPLERPEVVVSAIVIEGDHWLIKASSLAAEGLVAFDDMHHHDTRLSALTPGPRSKNRRTR